MRNKVLFDSCVIVAASVFVSAKDDIGIELKHSFYEQSIALVSLARKHLAKRVGIVTSTIETEALGVLSRVIEGELEKRVKDRKTVFKMLSIAYNACEMRMRKVLQCLQREPVDIPSATKFFLLVNNMYDELSAKAETLPKTAAAKASAVPSKFRKATDWFDVYRTQDEQEHAQIMNLIIKPIEEVDKRILAEAAYLLNSIYKGETKDASLFFASTDHHFSPVRRKGWLIEGREVTDEINKRFGVICDWPDQVLKEVSKRLK